MAHLHKALLKSGPTFLTVMRDHWFTLLVLFFAKEFFAYFFSYFQGFFTHSNEFELIALVGFAMTLSDLAISSILLILIPFWLSTPLSNSQISLRQFCSQKISSLCIENLRAIAQIVRWSLLLFVPGIIRYFRYYFVSFIVLTSQSYHDGKVDALEESNQILKGATLPFAIFLLFISLTASVIPTHSFSDIMSAPFATVQQDALLFLISLFSTLFSFLYFQQLSKIRASL